MVSCLSDGLKTQEHFKRVCEYFKIKVLENGLMVKKSDTNFDANGNVKSEKIMHEVEQFLVRFVAFLKETVPKWSSN